MKEKKKRLTPKDLGLRNTTVGWAITKLVERGKVVNSGKRRNGQVVWITAGQHKRRLN